jgi:hypothetical protein
MGSLLYCPPKPDPSRLRRAPDGSGLYPELLALGFDDGASAALLSKVGRACALLPSFAQARRELAEDGLHLKSKVIHRIASRLCGQVLTKRRRDLERFRKGELPAGNELAGKRVGVAVDGGRVRLRKAKEGKKKGRKARGAQGGSKKRRPFTVRWREPKVLIIFEIGPDGRMAKKSRPLIDGTFHGPDEAMELLALHLHRLGVAKAREVVFLADGAPWAWERIEKTLQGLGIGKATYVLDFYHAVGQLSAAVAALTWDAEPKRRLFEALRELLKKGKARTVVRQLRREGQFCAKWSAMQQHVDYLDKHARAGRLRYPTLRRRKLPQGSGAIESAIRRVVNLRLKGSGLMWLEKNAEGMLALRAAALTGRWEELLSAVRKEMGTDGVIDPGPLSREPSPDEEPPEPKQKHKSQRQYCKRDTKQIE